MAYIGRDIDKISNVEVLDNITFDGSSSYTLQKGGSNFTPSSANTLLVSINGVVQAGNFTVSGSTIDFGTAVAGTSTCDFILHYGVGLITTPADGTVTEAKIGTGAVTSSKLASGAVPNQSAFKNIFINGDMSIAQRGTTSSSTGYQTVDRWQLNTGTQQEQKTDTPNARFSNSFEVTGTTAGSSGYGICSQRIESKNVLPVLGQTCTLSAYVKNTGTSTVNVSVEVYRANSTDNFSGLTLLTSLTGQAITASWNRITFPSFTVTDACATGLEVRIFRYDASNDQEWLLTGVQLEAGTIASDFEFLPYDVNLRRCMRYCQVLINGDVNNYSCMGFAQSANLANILFPFYVEPRVPATGITVQNVNGFGATTVASGGRGSAATFGQASKYAVHWQLTTDTGSFVAGYPLFLYNYNTALDAKIIFTGMEL